MTDTTRTRAELVTQAGEELLLIAAGQELETEDQQKIDSRVDGMFAELSARGVCDVTDDGAIPIEWAECLALLLANASATAFGKPRMAEQARDQIEDRLRIMVKRIPAANQYLKGDLAMTKGPNFTYSNWLRGS